MLLDDMGLGFSGEVVSETYLEQTGVHTAFEVSVSNSRLRRRSSPPPLPIIQEATTNIVRHAAATCIGPT